MFMSVSVSTETNIGIILCEYVWNTRTFVKYVVKLLFILFLKDKQKAKDSHRSLIRNLLKIKGDLQSTILHWSS